MKKEIKTFSFSIIINVVVFLTKIIGGIIFKSKSLIADGFHSLSDLITDIVAIIGLKSSKKRANKTFPFGYGKLEYITSIFIALTIFILGIITIANSISQKSSTLNTKCIFIIIICIILKFLNYKYLLKKGINDNSPILISSSRESIDDVTTSVGVIIVIILTNLSNKFYIFKYADMIGGIIIGLLIFKTSFSMLKENVIALLGTNDINEKLIEKITEVINQFKSLRYVDASLIKNGSYYLAYVDVECIKNIKVNEFLKIESEIKRIIKRKNIGIKYIDIDIVPSNND